MTKTGAYGRPRCEDCGRVLTWKEFGAGLAGTFTEYRDTLGGPMQDDWAAHTYDCQNERRRRTPTEEGREP